MSPQAETITVTLSPSISPVLLSIAGETPSQKITYLLRREIIRYLEDVKRELMELEIKYGMEYDDFRQKSSAGELGDEFGYELEIDAMRWDDLVQEKKHLLRQLNLFKGLDLWH